MPRINSSGQKTQNSIAYPIESVDKALRLLRHIHSEATVTVTSASAELGVAPSTAHRLLAMLQHHGFARQDRDTKAYMAGRAMLEIGLSALARLDVRAVARPELQALVSEVRETVQLVILQGPRTLVVDAVETTEAVRVSARTGGSLPPHCTSAGKVLLADLAFEEVAEMLGPDPLEQLTPNSIGTLAELEDELERVRERGYATNFGENELALAAVAVAIPVPKGAIPAAITVSAPAMRLTDANAPEVVAAARAAAERISARVEGHV
jgi:IclR family transcriptional regulator, acetate operon repressor